MDGKAFLAQRARDFFAERIDDVIHMVRQDRQELRGWQEPAHLRAVVRRAVREINGTDTTATIQLADLDTVRAAGEPDRGQQREAFGQLLECAATALEKTAATNAAPDLTTAEQAGLEVALLLYARPAILVSEQGLAAVPAFWNMIEDQRDEIEQSCRGVGRIEMLGHPEFDWAGTGFLVTPTTLLTTRRTAELFAEQRDACWGFRPGISAWMDYRPQNDQPAAAGYRVRAVRGIHDVYDIALLEVEPPQGNGTAPAPLALAARPPERVDGRPAYQISFPVRDARRSEPEFVGRIFRDAYNVKRVQPGTLRGVFQFGPVQFLRHDCGPLGTNAGAPLVDLETNQVLGVQVTGRYLEGNTAVPLWTLQNDPMFRACGVEFEEASARQREEAFAQMEQLSRTRYFGELRRFLAELSRKAFTDRCDGAA